MLYNLVQKYAGKETVVMIDTMPKCKARRIALKNSQRKGLKRGKVEYIIALSESNEKYKRPPHNPRLGGGDATVPRLKKWD